MVLYMIAMRQEQELYTQNLLMDKRHCGTSEISFIEIA